MVTSGILRSSVVITEPSLVAVDTTKYTALSVYRFTNQRQIIMRVLLTMIKNLGLSFDDRPSFETSSSALELK